MTMVGSISKRVLFILTYITITAESMVRLFLHYMWKLYSLTNDMVSDRALQLVTLFTRKLYCLFGIEIVSFLA